MTTELKRPDHSEDIDLLLLLDRSVRFFTRYKWVFSIAILVGIAWGVYQYVRIPKTYRSTLVLHSFFLTNQENIQIADNWNALLVKKEFTSLASIFNCDKSIVAKIKEIKAEDILKVFAAQNPNGFSIRVTVLDNSILPILQNGIVHAFENSDYLRERIAFKKASYVELIAQASKEIASLDSTKAIIQQGMRTGAAHNLPVIIDASGINRQLVDLNEKKLMLAEGLRFSNAVQVLQSFSVFSIPVGPNLSVLLVIGIVVAVAVAYVISLYLSVREKLRRRHAQLKSI